MVSDDVADLLVVEEEVDELGDLKAIETFRGGRCGSTPSITIPQARPRHVPRF
jgi:hypothetical protein